MAWYGLDWGSGPRPASWDTKLATWNAFVGEDLEMLEPVQRSLNAAHTGIPLHCQERRIWHHHAEIDRRITPHWSIRLSCGCPTCSLTTSIPDSRARLGYHE